MKLGRGKLVASGWLCARGCEWLSRMKHPGSLTPCFLYPQRGFAAPVAAY